MRKEPSSALDAKNLLSIIIPVYNEEKTIAEIIDRVLKVPLSKEIIVVDDGSTDDTFSAIEPYVEDEAVRLIRINKNSGKGEAIRRGLEAVSGAVVVIQDGDLEYDPLDFVKMSKLIFSGESNVVYGSRNLRKNPRSYRRYYWGGIVLSWLVTILFGKRITDESTCYKMFRTELLQSLNIKSVGFEFCPEVTAKVLRRGEKIVEVPINYSPRSIKDGKKIRWHDGVIAAWTLIKYRFLA